MRYQMHGSENAAHCQQQDEGFDFEKSACNVVRTFDTDHHRIVESVELIPVEDAVNGVVFLDSPVASPKISCRCESSATALATTGTSATARVTTVSFIISGVSFSDLSLQNKEDIKQSVVTRIVAQTTGVKSSDVMVTLSAGSVKVGVQISGHDANSAATELSTESGPLAAAVAGSLNSLGLPTTGTIEVISFEVSAQVVHGLGVERTTGVEMRGSHAFRPQMTVFTDDGFTSELANGALYPVTSKRFYLQVSSRNPSDIIGATGCTVSPDANAASSSAAHFLTNSCPAGQFDTQLPETGRSNALRLSLRKFVFQRASVMHFACTIRRCLKEPCSVCGGRRLTEASASEESVTTVGVSVRFQADGTLASALTTTLATEATSVSTTTTATESTPVSTSVAFLPLSPKKTRGSPMAAGAVVSAANCRSGWLGMMGFVITLSLVTQRT